jgi:hypothetical protein
MTGILTGSMPRRDGSVHFVAHHEQAGAGGLTAGAIKEIS